MNLFVKIWMAVLLLNLFPFEGFSQNEFSPIAYFSFDNNSTVDEMGFAELSLRNNAALYSDPQRGSVLRFDAPSKSYAAINKNLLDNDAFTISFFFFWENAFSGSWHQLFEVHDPSTNSNFFFTPQNGWGNKMNSVISDRKEYSLYEAISGRQLSKNTWMHIAITFNNKVVTTYINGVEDTKGYISFSPSSLQADSMYFGGNPYRADNFYISARLDEIIVFDQSLTPNQITALYQELEIPQAENYGTDWNTSGDPLLIKIDLNDKKQSIQNFGSSDGWNTQRIGKYWPEDKKEKLAELLFSDEKDEDGNPKGIGLSAWRFNIGAGTTEQGDASRISAEWRRTECFLNPDGVSYNWNKQIGQQWFLKKAALDYNINHIIGWQNSPPVLYTENNLGFREYGAPMSTILKEEHFDDFAKFLADVSEHFETEGIFFDYISPLNEPQYGWAPDSFGGTVSQEGSPWTNQEIHDVVTAIDDEFTVRDINTKIFITEAGSVHYHISGNGHASNQLLKFWNPFSTLSLVGKPSFSNIVSYHSYWKDYGAELVNQRQDFFENLLSLNPVPEAWQTEYSLLGNGYRSGYPDGYKLSEMESALSLAKVIITDLNVANTTAWQWWSTFGKGKHSGEARFCLIEAFTKNDNTDGEYHLNKLFYSLGNFSHFIRPSMTRLGIDRSDGLTPFQQTSDLLFSAYTNQDENRLVLVAVNLTDQARAVELLLQNSMDKVLKNQQLYLTDEFTSLRVQDIDFPTGKIVVPAHSVLSYTADLDQESKNSEVREKNGFDVWYSSNENKVMIATNQDVSIRQIELFTISGNLVGVIDIKEGQRLVSYPAYNLPDGMYVVIGKGRNYRESQKVIIIN